MSNKLYIGNLSWGISGDDLKEIFSEFGEVTDSVVISDRETGRSRGFGFVEYSNGPDSEKAIEAMNGKEVDGRALKVNVAQAKQSRGGGGGGGRY